MSARKTRPEHGDGITPDMSVRDQAAALGTSVAELCRWRALAAIPQADFEHRLAAHKATGRLPSASSILAMNTPVPARGRVQRAVAIYGHMTPAERREFLALAGVPQ